MVRRPPSSTLFPYTTLFRSPPCWPDRNPAPVCRSLAHHQIGGGRGQRLLQLRDMPVQGGQIDLLVHVVGHARQLDVAIAAVQPFAGPVLPGLIQRRHHLAAGLPVVQVERHQTGLLVAALPAQTGRLDHAHHEQVVVLRVEDVHVQLGCVFTFGPVQVAALDEGVVQLVTGGLEYEVVFGAGAVGKSHPVPVDGGDIPTRGDVAMPQMVEDQRIDHGVGLVHAVIGVRQTVVRGLAEDHADHGRIDALLERARQTTLAAEGVDGPAPDELGQEVVAPAQADIHAGGVVYGVHGDVRPGVAAADQQHPLALEYLGAAVIRRMHQFAAELPRQTGDVRLVQGAVGDQHAIESAPLLYTIALAEQHPAVPVRRQLDDPGVELVMASELEVRGVVVEVAAHLAVVRVGRHAVVHGEFGELGHALGRDQVSAVVHGAVRVVYVPQAADITVLFETDEGDSKLLQIACAGQTHGSGADDGIHVC